MPRRRGRSWWSEGSLGLGPPEAQRQEQPGGWAGGEVEGLGEDVTEASLGHPALVLSLECQVGFGQVEVKKTKFGVFSAKSEQVTREAGAWHGRRTAFFQRSLSCITAGSSLPAWGIFMTPSICLQSASGLL